MPADQIEYTALQGGLDLQSSALTIRPGRALDLHNFEATHGGGYRRIFGYERYCGSPGPSQWMYQTFTVNTTTGLSVGQSVTGSTSGSGGTIVAVSGLTVVVGYPPDDLPAFVSGETIASGAVTLTSNSTARVPGSANDIVWLNATWDLVRSTVYPALTAPDVPGSGPVRGVYVTGTGATLVAFRDATDGLTQKAYYAVVDQSNANWQELNYPTVVAFDGGTGTTGIAEGDTITGATSGTSAIVIRKIVFSGADGTSDSAGYFLCDTPVTGTGFVDNENIQKGGVTKCVANGNDYVYSLSPGGRHEFVQHDFRGGASAFPQTFGCDGVNPAYEVTLSNGGYVLPILMPDLTGAPTTNAPKYLEVHKNHLFLSFEGGSVQHSVLGEPMTFNGFLGAAEFALGDNCTGMRSITGGGLALYTRRKTFLLTGTSAADWVLTIMAERTGAIDYTVLSLGQTYSLDDYGLTTLQRVQAYGDFDAKPLSRDVQRALDARVNAPINSWGEASSVVGAYVVRKSNQYRLVFSDGSGMIFYVNERGGVEPSTFKFAFVPHSVYPCRMSDGKDRIFAGDSASGRVYELERGYSFDGDNIRAVARLPFNHLKSPRLRKSYRQMELETALAPVDDSETPSIGVYADIDFGSLDNPVVSADAARIGTGMNWELIDGDATYWTDAQEKATTVPLTGTGNNISFVIVNDSDRAAPFTLHGLVLRFRPRRPDRS